MTLAQLPTPCLLLDKQRMDRNIARLAGRLQRLGVALRPHLKTAKSVEVARRMMASPAGPATVSTLKEAEEFAAAGVRDILYAVGIAPSKLDRVLALRAKNVDLSIILDSIEQARAVAAKCREARATIPALIEIDSDDHRAGVRPGDGKLLEIGRCLHEGGAELRGVMTHAGGSYDSRSADELVRAAERERDCVVQCAQALRAAGLPSPYRQCRLHTDSSLRSRSDRRHRGPSGRLRLLRPGDGRHRRVRSGRHRDQRARQRHRSSTGQATDSRRCRMDGDVARSRHLELSRSIRDMDWCATRPARRIPICSCNRSTRSTASSSCGPAARRASRNCPSALWCAFFPTTLAPPPPSTADTSSSRVGA